MLAHLYDILAAMAETLIGFRQSLDEPSEGAPVGDMHKKANLMLPYGCDFATWQARERRNLDRLADSALRV